MLWAKSVCLGCVGGLVGVAIWAAIVFRSGRHVGWFVGLVGVLVGIGVRSGADGALKTEHGELAVAIAIACVFLGKYAAAHWMAARLRLGFTTDDEFMTAVLADRIVAQRQATGQKLVWPKEKGLPGVPHCLRYPAEIWTEAQRQWKQMSPAERRAEIKQYRQGIAELLNGAIANLRRLGFRSSFGLLSLIWIVVAALAAFCLASGKVSW